MIKAGIIGSTGYAGAELVRILLNHPEVTISWYGSRSYIDEKYASIYGNMFELVSDVCKGDDISALADEVDVIFTATPQGFLAGVLTEEILSKVKVVDLSADYRIKDVATYEKWYGIEHKSPQFIEEAVYGLCEINREDVKKARLVAKQQVISTVLANSLKQMENSDDKTYFQIVLKLVEKNSQNTNGKIAFNENDLRRLPDNFINEVNKVSKGKLELSDTPVKIKSGFILIYNGIEENCSFDAIFRSKHEELTDKISALLFQY